MMDLTAILAAVFTVGAVVLIYALLLSEVR
jgi:hypothetical protein